MTKSSAPAANTFAPPGVCSRSSARSRRGRAGRGSRPARRCRAASRGSWRRSRPRSRPRRVRGASPRRARGPARATVSRRCCGRRTAPGAAPRRSRGTASPISAASGRPRSRHGASRVRIAVPLHDLAEEVVRRKEDQVPARVAVLLDHVVLVRRHVLGVAREDDQVVERREVAARRRPPRGPPRRARPQSASRAPSRSGRGSRRG